LKKVNLEHSLVESLGENGYFLLGVGFFAIMGTVLYRIAMKKQEA
jgi:hypothetical protein